MSAQVLHPTVLWAQRHNSIIITLDLQDVRDPEITFDNDEAAKAGKVSFRGKAHSHATGPEEHAYLLDLELYGEIDKDDVRQSTTARTITLRIGKKEPGPYWPRLLKAPGKTPPYIKVDWDRWVDEDEEDGDDMPGMDQFAGMGGGGLPGGMDMASLMAQMGQSGGGGGGGGFGGEDEDGDDDDDADDDLPPLEATAPK